ncbi:hypothetical protein CspeluHIS016_0402130 [Cutaneotrichosporon spelunceum]|uniref:RRM domain-containing protein n=1 Tax=Cutaneotrichosporon spelunceum TaxID=1672016 RepID=A0AAD3TVQ3_9TREE|nr:hypothetical protein CspeluHIS016_0402130 [Cutaneotrichosporon spelunceum]
MKQWWPHPTKTPFPFRSDNLKSLMIQHFSKYGPLRLVQPINVEVETADTVLVIFKEEHSVYKVLDDPKSIHCIFQSASRTTSIPFDVKINRIPSTTYTHNIWIKLTGARPDARSRSASPSFGDPSLANAGYLDTNVLPEKVTVWAVPYLGRRGQRLFYRVFVSGPGFDARPGFEQAERETGEPCREIRKINFGRRNPEKEIIAELVESFVDILNITKPSERTNHGWILECGAGHRDMDELLTTVHQMPGITIRKAKPEEYAPHPSPATTQPASDANDSAPSTAEEARLPDRPVSPEASVIPDINLLTRTTTTLSEGATSDGTSNHPQPGDAIAAEKKNPLKSTEDTGQSRPSSAESMGLGLIRKLVPMYRGRQLREEIDGGESRFVDDAAIFVGHLVKEKETQLTLLKRFERYGRITAIEYNPQRAGRTHASSSRARILFQDSLSAYAAIEKEASHSSQCNVNIQNGAVSFGSPLRVEERRVLPHDVQAREMFIDNFGRAISPSMVSQYSPPSPATVPQISLPQTAVPPIHEWARPWFNATGGTSAMPAIIPTPLMAAAHDGYDGKLQSMVVPVMWPAGFGIYPAMMAPMMPCIQHRIPTSDQVVPHNTASSPPNPPRHGESISPTPRTPDAKPKVTRPPSQAQNSYVTAGLPTPPSCEAALPGAPRVTGAGYQNGLFMPTYDAHDLKTWRKARGIEETNLRSTTAPAFPEYLPLLPIFTGGHDPASTLPTPPKGKQNSECGPSVPPVDSPKKQHHLTSRNEYSLGLVSSGLSTSRGDAVRPCEAAARPVHNLTAREQIRAHLSQSFQVRSSPTHHNVVSLPVPFTAETDSSLGARRSSSAPLRESLAPKPKGRGRGDERRRQQQNQNCELAPNSLDTTVRQVVDKAAKDSLTGW